MSRGREPDDDQGLAALSALSEPEDPFESDSNFESDDNIIQLGVEEVDKDDVIEHGKEEVGESAKEDVEEILNEHVEESINKDHEETFQDDVEEIVEDNVEEIVAYNVDEMVEDNVEEQHNVTEDEDVQDDIEADLNKNWGSGGMTYAERAKANGMRYTVTDVPPLGLSILFGIQHYMTMLGATVLIPLIVTPAMGASTRQTADVISTIFFVSGINTLIQTTIGDRLPIVQGGSFAYLAATFSIIANPELQAIQDNNERFLQTMGTIQGAIIVSGGCQMFVGYSGLIVPLIRFISPVVIAPVVAAVGLSLYAVGWQNISACFSMGLTQMGVIIFFSQYLKKVTFRGYPFFAMFPIILAIVFTWSLNGVLTAVNIWDANGEYATCRTDSSLLDEVPWFRVPYPVQWGIPVFETYAILPMLGAAMAGMVESISDYYSCAKLCGAPPPTPGIISRGIAGEGIGVVISGVFGSGNGTTSYSENIGALSLTRVGSRVVIQCGALTMILVSVISKVGALFATMPAGIVGGIYATVFGLIIAVGLSNLQYVDLNCERNLFILGFAIYNCLSIAGPGGYFSTQDQNPFGNTTAAEIALAFFSSPIIIAMLSSFILDNTIPGSPEQRGMQIWTKVRDADIHNDPEYVEVYSLPLFLSKLFRNCGCLEFPSRGRFPDPPKNGFQPGRGDIGDLCCPCWLPPRPEEQLEA